MPARSSPLLLTFFVPLLVVLAGCTTTPPPATPEPPVSDATPAYPTGVHPYPRGDEWPLDLHGPFELDQLLDLDVPSHDATPLDGWLYLPKLPPDVKAPVVLWSSPYFGYPHAPADDAAMRNHSVVPIDFLVSHGYAVAAVSVRGTGNSGGCFTNKGLAEQKDQALLVEWLAQQPWSNGRVGMLGGSYAGTTPLMAAIHNPPHLKTIVVIGPVTDPYTELHTPQGAFYTGGGTGDALRRGAVGLVSPLNGDPDYVLERVAHVPDEACPETVRVLTAAEQGHFTDDRDAAYWNERRLIDGFPNLTTSVFIAHGLLERDHPYQEDPVWPTFTQAPKRMLLGQWGHEAPRLPQWRQEMVTWLDFWLKGLGHEPPKLGLVDYQDDQGTWSASSQWPPAEAQNEVLYLTQGKLSPTPQAGSATFRSAPQPRGLAEVLCPLSPMLPSLDAPPGLVYLSDPLPNPVFLAGNPFAYLRLESDLPGGLVAVHLFDLAASFHCHDGTPHDLELLGHGVADLRFHAGNLHGVDFPTNTPTHVRVDVTNFAERIAAGHRLAIVTSYGVVAELEDLPGELTTDKRTGRSGQPYTPLVTIDGEGAESASHIVLPLVNGTLGGQAPTLTYPPRPFVPHAP